MSSTSRPESPATGERRAGADAAYLLALALPACLLLQRQDWVIPHTGLGSGLGVVCGLAIVGVVIVLQLNGTHVSVVRRGPVPFLLLVWAVAILASYLPWSMTGLRTSPLLADLELVQYLLEAIFVLGLTAALATGERVWTFTKVLTACGGLYGLLLIVTSVAGTEVAEHLRLPVLQIQNTIANVEATRGGFIRSQGMAGHPLEAGAVSAALTPLGLGLCRGLAVRGAPWRLWALMCGFELVGALSTFSRSATVAVAVAVVVMAVRWSPKIITGVVAAAVALVLVAAAAVPDRLSAYVALFQTSSASDSSLYSRALARRHVADVLASQFWTGEGMQTQDVLGRPTLDNQYLGFAVELGVPSALAFIALLVVPVLYLLHRSTRLPGGRGEVALGLAGSIAAVAVILSILDAFAFHQIRLVTYVLLALVGAVTARTSAGAPNTSVVGVDHGADERPTHSDRRHESDRAHGR